MKENGSRLILVSECIYHSCFPVSYEYCRDQISCNHICYQYRLSQFLTVYAAAAHFICDNERYHVEYTDISELHAQQCITVKSDFIGTTQALAGCLISEIELPDTIALYRYNGDDRFTVTIHDTGETRTGLYCEEYLHTKDAYRVFLGGNFGHVSIEFDDRDSSPRPRLLLFKDSFALSLLPFLARHYDVDLIDPRYDAEAALSALLKEQQFDSALILLGRDTCATSAAIHRWCRRALA
jgi:hypothetical protein